MSTLNVFALQRGGYSAYGRAWYDPRSLAVISQAQEGEIVNLRAEFFEDINTINYTVNGVESSEPAVTDAVFTVSLSNFRAAGSIRFDVLLESGEMRHLNVWINGLPRASPPNPGGDYGSFV